MSDGSMHLSDQQVADFARDGFLKIPGAFGSDVAKSCSEYLLNCLETEQGVDVSSPSKARHMISRRQHPVLNGMISDRLLAALDDLLGAGRWNRAHFDSHGVFFATFPGFSPTKWSVPIGVGRWHIDLGFEDRSHFDIQDGNCAVVPAFLFTASMTNGAPTVAVQGSHRLVARLLVSAKSPVPRFQMTAFCESLMATRRLQSDVVQLTGEPGDVVIFHPHLIHAASAHNGEAVRIMCNTGIGLHGNRRLRPDDDRSIVDDTIYKSIVDCRPTSLKSGYLRVLLYLNYQLWRMRYTVHGQLPNLVEVSLPIWRRVFDRSLRHVSANIARMAAAAVARRSRNRTSVSLGHRANPAE